MLKTLIKYINSGERGQTLVEFALIVALLLALLFGIMEFARAWQYTNALTNGVRDGSLYAARLSNSASFTTSVHDYTFGQITSAIPRGNLQVAVYKNNTLLTTSTDPGVVAGDDMTVEATYDFEVLTGSIIPFFSGTRELSRQATMRHE